MNQLLYHFGFTYKKPKLIPSTADADKQREFLEQYREMQTESVEKQPILFMDARYPQHNVVAGHGWIKRGQNCELRSNIGSRRLNINGVIDADTRLPIVRYGDRVNAQSTIELFKEVERNYPESEKVRIICDNARYYRSKLVRGHLED